MIDAHVHFWRYSAAQDAGFGWIDARMDVLKRDFLPQHLAQLTRPSGPSHAGDTGDTAVIEGCIAVQAAQMLEETRFLLRLSDEHAFVRGVVGWVDLRAEHVESELEEFAAHPRFKGVRHIAQDEQDDRFLAREDVVRGIAKLARFDLAYDVLVYARQLPAAIELCRSLPNQRFVLDHVGKPEIRAQKHDPWAEHLRELAQCENVACKLSGLVTEADWQRWTPDDLAFYLETALEAFGPERVMIGSDWPVCLLAASYADAIGVARGAVAAFSADERAAMLTQNALHWYRA